MDGRTVCAVATMALASSYAAADSTLQFDINQLGVQARNGAGQNSAFGGISHTGSINLSMSPNATVLGILMRSGNGAFVDQHFNGSLTGLTGTIDLVGGQVRGGTLSWTVNSGDTYSARISSNSGQVRRTSSQGGFTIDGLTFDGRFTDGMFGNVDVSEFFNAQNPNGLPGSYLEFNFTLNNQGAGTADLDAFVQSQAIPLPSAGLAGMTGLIGLAGVGAIRRRR
jgi:hypothetical protein